MEKIDLVQVIPRIKVLETKLLDKGILERMVNSKNAEEVLKILEETEYATLISKINRPEDYEIILKSSLQKLYSTMYEMIPNRAVVDVAALKYDYHNIKVLIKGKLLNKDLSEILIPVGTTTIEALKAAVYMEDYSKVTAFVKDGIEEALENFKACGDSQRIDIILDKYIFREMIYISRKLQSDFLDKYISYTIDLANIKTLIRVKEQRKSRDFLNLVTIEGGTLGKDKISSLFAESLEAIANKLDYTSYGKILTAALNDYIAIGSTRLLEKLSDNAILDFIKDAKIITSGIAPIIAYIHGKENEIKLIRIIMVGKINHIEEALIKERLRDNYV